jgi:hypothetical protein
MSDKERTRKTVFERVRSQGFTLQVASEWLGLSYRRTRRSNRWFLAEGDAGLVHGNRPRLRPIDKAPVQTRLDKTVHLLSRHKPLKVALISKGEHKARRDTQPPRPRPYPHCPLCTRRRLASRTEHGLFFGAYPRLPHLPNMKSGSICATIARYAFSGSTSSQFYIFLVSNHQNRARKARVKAGTSTHGLRCKADESVISPKAPQLSTEAFMAG